MTARRHNDGEAAAAMITRDSMRHLPYWDLSAVAIRVTIKLYASGK